MSEVVDNLMSILGMTHNVIHSIHHKPTLMCADIAVYVKNRFPEYPVRIDTIPGDSNCLGVLVFNVPQELEREVVDYIQELQERVADYYGLELLPMVKSPSVTKEFYPEMRTK